MLESAIRYKKAFEILKVVDVEVIKIVHLLRNGIGERKCVNS